MKETILNGYRRHDLEFEGMPAIVVFANDPEPGNKWLFKTEYFSAFQGFETDMLARGYHLAHVANATRWAFKEDVDRQARFAAFLAEEYGFAPKCLSVGMSCGGLEAIMLAAAHPETTAAMALDAPVIDLLSCPFHVGREADDGIAQEYTRVTGRTLKDMLAYRDHPLDHLREILHIPVYLSCGTDDRTVPYEENGKLLADFFKRNNGDVTVELFPGRDHHPHFTDGHNEKIIQWAMEKY